MANQNKMKKVQNRFFKTLKTTLRTTPGYIIIGVFTLGIIAVPGVQADRFDDQINSLTQQNAANQANVNALQAEAVGFQAKVNQLQSQINQLQASINENQAKQADLQRQITEAQAEIDSSRKVLGENLKTMYLDGQLSTVEMLATSKDLSEYVDKQEYRTTVQNKITASLQRIAALQKQLEAQKLEIEKLLADQAAQQNQLAADRREQANLLAYNFQQQAEYDAASKANQSKISQLRQQQAAEIARIFANSKVVRGGACDTKNGDTYPARWCSIPLDAVIDSWGMYNRECVSYTAWKVHESGRHMPYWGGVGNANQWDENAVRAGIPVDTTPRAGDVAIKNSGFYGHAMYVESVNGDGTINISQYNADWNGRFSRVYDVSTAGLVFIHF